MEIEWKIFIINFIVIFPLVFFLKGNLHFKYLKVFDDEYVKEFNTFSEAYLLKSWSGKIMTLGLPFFNTKGYLGERNLKFQIFSILVYQWITIFVVIVVIFFT